MNEQERFRRLALLLPIARRTAGQMARKIPVSIDPNDLLASAQEAMWKLAIRDIADEEMLKLAPFRALGAVKDELRRHDWPPRGQKEFKIGYVDDFFPVTSFDGAPRARVLPEPELILDIQRGIERLTDAERSLLRRHFTEGVKMCQMARERGLSQPRISQLFRRIFKKMVDGDTPLPLSRAKEHTDGPGVGDPKHARAVRRMRRNRKCEAGPLEAQHEPVQDDLRSVRGDGRRAPSVPPVLELAFAEDVPRRAG